MIGLEPFGSLPLSFLGKAGVPFAPRYRVRRLRWGHFPETKNCISAIGALERRLTVDPLNFRTPIPVTGRPEFFRQAGIVFLAPVLQPDRFGGRIVQRRGLLHIGARRRDAALASMQSDRADIGAVHRRLGDEA